MILGAQNLSIVRGGKLVIDQVSASLEPGQITAICGPNGAGKSSLLLGLAGLLAPAGGAVLLADQTLASIGPQDRAKSIGYLPQAAEVAWNVAVENIVALGRMPHRDRGAEAVERAISALDLEPLRHRPASQLSGGEKARALFARVLAGEPEWILADEPLSALDLAHQIALIRHVKSAAIGGQGVVIVLHDLSFAMNHADRVLVLRAGEKGGRLVADGPPESALTTDVIGNTWGVAARWIGEPGARALVTS